MNPKLRLLSTLPCLLATALCATSAHAEDEIATDRPDFVESSDVVGAGRVQIELGFVQERSREGSLKSRGRATPALLRIGLGDTLEARIETDGLLRSTVTDSSTGISTRDKGSADVSLGLKWHQRDGEEKTGSPALAWLLHVDLDSGSGAFRGQGKRPSLRLVAEWELPGEWSVGVMPGIAKDSDDQGRHFWAGILAATASTEIAPNWRAFGEIAGQRLASKSRGGNIVTLDGGVTWLLDKDMQVDLSVNRGLTRYTPDWAWGLGWSKRF